MYFNVFSKLRTKALFSKLLSRNFILLVDELNRLESTVKQQCLSVGFNKELR